MGHLPMRRRDRASRSLHCSEHAQPGFGGQGVGGEVVAVLFNPADRVAAVRHRVGMALCGLICTTAGVRFSAFMVSLNVDTIGPGRCPHSAGTSLFRIGRTLWNHLWPAPDRGRRPHTLCCEPDFERHAGRAAPALGVQAIKTPVRSAVDIVRAIDAFAAEPNGSLLVLSPTPTTAIRDAILKVSAQHRLPAIAP